MNQNEEHDELRRQNIIEQFAKAQTCDETMPLYDSWAQKYNEDVQLWGYHLDKHLDEFEDFVRISKESRVLDVAAGTGLVGQKLKERGYMNVDALDGSVGMIEFAKSKNIYKNYFQVMLGPQLIKDVDKDCYDSLICVGSLMPKLINEQCFEPLITITKPGGFIYFLTAVQFLKDQRSVFEDKMRTLQREGKWRWILMKESPDKYCRDYQALVYAFKVRK